MTDQQASAKSAGAIFVKGKRIIAELVKPLREIKNEKNKRIV
jgi:hypothetical protein